MNRVNPLFTDNINCESVISDYCEFSGLDRDFVTSKVEASLTISAREWNKNVLDANASQVQKFYTASDYIYEVFLAYLHPEKFYKKEQITDILKFVKKTKGKNVLEFGGGTGQLCLLMHFNTDKEVTYVDLPGRLSEFAKWRFKKHGANINMLYSDVEELKLPQGKFDLLVSEAVLEHVPNLEQAVKTLTGCLKPNGKFYLLFDTEYSERFPMHISANKDIQEIASKEQLFRIDNAVYVKSNGISTRIKHSLYKSSPYPLKQAITGINHPHMITRKIASKTKSLV